MRASGVDKHLMTVIGLFLENQMTYKRQIARAKIIIITVDTNMKPLIFFPFKFKYLFGGDNVACKKNDTPAEWEDLNGRKGELAGHVLGLLFSDS